MAKKKKVVKEEKVIETIDEVVKVTETLETLPVAEAPVKSEDEKSEIEVIGLQQAEQLQKSGWQLIDCHMTENGKLYKFKKG